MDNRLPWNDPLTTLYMGSHRGSFLASEIAARKFFKFYSNRLERMMVRARFARCCWYDHQALGLGLRGLGNALRPIVSVSLPRLAGFGGFPKALGRPIGSHIGQSRLARLV